MEVINRNNARPWPMSVQIPAPEIRVGQAPDNPSVLGRRRAPRRADHPRDRNRRVGHRRPRPDHRYRGPVRDRASR
jgi:hypothetical protein